MRTLIRSYLPQDSNRLLLVLVCVDVLFIVLHVLYSFREYTGLDNPRFSIAKDQGFAEIFQYLKYALVISIFLFLGRHKTRSFYLIWGLLFSFFLLDDSYGLHESYGGWVAAFLGYAPLFSLRPQDFGELTIYVAIASLFLGLIGIAYFRIGTYYRAICKQLLTLLLGFAGFAVVIDMLHSMVQSFIFNNVLRLFEDGGEMIMMSLICAFVFHLYRVRDLGGPHQSDRIGAMLSEGSAVSA